MSIINRRINIQDSGILIGGFKAIGKSTLAKKHTNVIDVEIGDFEYIIDEKLEKISVEKRKGLKNRTKNPDYPLNYYNELLSYLKKNYIVLFAPKAEVVELLHKNNVHYCFAWPEENMLDEIIERSKNRGNNEEFISKITKVYYRDHPKENDDVIWIKKGQFLEDVLIERGILKA